MDILYKLNRHLSFDKSNLKLENWDPDGAGLFSFGNHMAGNKRYAMEMVGSKPKFTEYKASFAEGYGDNNGWIKYSNNRQLGSNEYDKYKHVKTIYYNAKTGDTYLEGENGQWVKGNKLKSSEYGWASDSDLDSAVNGISFTPTTSYVKPITLDQQLAIAGTIDSISTAPTAQAVQLVNDLYALAQAQADAQLQALIGQDSVTSPEVKDDTVYYKYGPHEVDLKYYIHNASANLQRYLDSKTKWSQAQKDAFLKSFENYKAGLNAQLEGNDGRFYTDDAGLIRDTQSKLAGTNERFYIDTNGNVYNSLEEIQDKKLRKTAKMFSPNDEVGAYLKTIGNAVVSAGKTKQGNPETNGDFDFKNHGFINYWANKINPAGGLYDLDPYLSLDPVNASGKRARTNRTKYLVHELTNYMNEIRNGNLKYENTAFKNKDNYLNAIQAAIDNLNNGWDSTDPASLQAIGITPDFYQQLMSEEANPTISPEQAALEDDKRKRENYKVAEVEYIKGAEGIYNNYIQLHPNVPVEGRELIAEDNPLYDPELNAESAKTNIAGALKTLGFDTGEGDESYRNTIAKASEMALNALRNGQSVITYGDKNIDTNMLLEILLPSIKKNSSILSQSSTDPNLYYFDDPDNDRKYGQILCLRNGRLFYTFIGNVKDCSAWRQIGEKFKTDYSKSVNAGTNDYKYSFLRSGGKFQEGGEIDMEALKALAEAESEEVQETPSKPSSFKDKLKLFGETMEEDLYGERRAAAKKKGMTYQRYNDKLRQLNGSPNFYNEENGVWKEEDYIRMGAIAADLVSMFDPDPLSGGLIGFGGTVTNLVADAKDDSVTGWEAFKNFAAGTGMDAIGLIPVVGDVAGTGSKLVKTAAKLAPKLGYALAAYGGLATLKNGDAIMESLRKVTSDEKLTVGDWQNIAQAISTVAGLNNYAKGKVASKVAKKRAVIPDQMGVGVRKGKNGEVLDILLTGEDTKALREAIRKGDRDAANAELKKLEGYSDYELNEVVSSHRPRLNKPWETTVDANNKKTREAKAPLHVERKIDFFDMYDKGKLRKGDGSSWTDWISRTKLKSARSEALQTPGTREVITKERADQMVEQALRERAISHGAIAKSEQIKANAKVADEKLNGTFKEDGTRNADGIIQKRKEINTLLTESKKRLTDFETELNSKSTEYSFGGIKRAFKDLELSNLKAELETEKSTLLGDIQKAKNSSKSKTKAVKKEIAEKKALIAKIDKDLESIQNLEQRKGETDNLQKQLASYDSEIADLKLQIDSATIKMDNDGKPIYSAETKAFLDDLKANSTINYDNGRTREITDYSDIITKLGLLKKGGRLKFLLPGGTVSGIGQNGSWYSTVGAKTWEEILKRLEKDPEYYKTINQALTEHAKLREEAKGNWDRDKAHTGINNSVGNYQTKYQGGGWNDIAIQPTYSSRYDFSGGNTRQAGRTSGDKATAWKSDNLYAGITDDRRLLGRYNAAWGDTDEYGNGIIDSKNAQLKKHGLELFLDKDSYYKLRKIGENNPETTNGTNPNPDGSYTDAGRTYNDPETTGPKSEGIEGFIRNFQNKYPDLMEAARLRFLNRNVEIGRREGVKNARNIFLQDAIEHHKDIHGDRRALAAGELQAAEVLSLAARANTSDGALHAAQQLEGQQRAQLYITATRDKDDAMIRNTMDASWNQEKENKAMRHNVGMQNRLAEIKGADNVFKINDAARNERVSNINNLWMKWVNDQYNERAQRKSLADAAAKRDIDLAVNQDYTSYGVTLTPDEERVFTNYQTGILPSSMSEEDKRALQNAGNKLDLAKARQLSIYYKLPTNRWSSNAYYRDREAGFTPTLVDLAKDGAKIKVAKIREKSKNADRLVKQIHKQIDSLDKKLERISKSMYGHPKSEIIKAK